MKCNQSRPGFEVVSPCPFPTTITIIPRAPHWREKLIHAFLKGINPKVNVIVQRYLSTVPPIGRVWHKAFFKMGPDTGLLPIRARHYPKFPGPRRHSPKKRRPRHQAINLTPPRRVKAWWRRPPEACPVTWHTRPDPCRWHHGQPKCDPSTGSSWLKRNCTTGVRTRSRHPRRSPAR